MQLKKGNLFNTTCPIIAHGVNCRGAFGSGVAGQIARLFPFAKQQYLEKYRREGWRLGDVQFVKINECWEHGEYRYIVNCATQDNYGYDRKKYVDYDAVGVCLNKLFEFAEGTSAGIAIPWIGCGLAGGDKDILRTILQQTLQEKTIHLEVWEF